jgi:hypothetical protein
MGKSKLHLRTLHVIAWLLIGVVCDGALLEYLSSAETNTVCLEERPSEFEEDGRCDLVDSGDLLLTAWDLKPHHSSWFEVATHDCWSTSGPISSACLTRGPPLA